MPCSWGAAAAWCSTQRPCMSSDPTNTLRAPSAPDQRSACTDAAGRFGPNSHYCLLLSFDVEHHHHGPFSASLLYSTSTAVPASCPVQGVPSSVQASTFTAPSSLWLVALASSDLVSRPPPHVLVAASLLLSLHLHLVLGI